MAIDNYGIRFGEREEAERLVLLHHYSRRFPSNVQSVVTFHGTGGLFGRPGDGECEAACIFSIPPTRWSEEVWELSRLVRTPTFSVPLTVLIAESVRRVSKNIDLLVSFADWTQGHHGGIYQAASWNYAGKRDRRMDGIIIGGQFVPGRSCNSIWGTQSPERLREKMPMATIEPHYDEGKHLYWKATRKVGRKKAERLGLERLPYPKPTQQTIDLGSLRE